MSTTFRPYQPKQKLLLPPDLRDWLPEGHLAYHVSDLVDGLDLTAFYAPYEGDGRRNAPYEPRMMVKVLIYGYATGVFSSRGMAKKLEEDVAFRMLAAGNFPAHRTISKFRRRHLEDFRKLFVEVVGLARELGLAKFGTLLIDGTKVRANASKRKAMTYRRMKREPGRLEAEIREWLRRADEIDAEEDVRYGEDRRGDEIPEELRTRKGRLAEIHYHSESGRSFAFETTLSGRGYIRWIPRWQAKGYRVKLLFLRLPTPEVAIKRVAQRVSEGGHDVPEPVIRRRFDAGWRNFNQIYRHLVDDWFVYDNSGRTPVLLEEANR